MRQDYPFLFQSIDVDQGFTKDGAKLQGGNYNNPWLNLFTKGYVNDVNVYNLDDIETIM